ncbi:MAG: hypothetical protein LBH36_03335 [Candidatus Nomurabacteria bacterium]|jgi:hypothetical protein|nr:hypothetical protein [Candidatus Nomurabacteria bacterium]
MVKKDEFAELFKYVQEMHADLKGDISELKLEMDERFERVEGALDSIIKDVDEKVSNVDALEAQVDRHERYFGKISNILEVDLDGVEA